MFGSLSSSSRDQEEGPEPSDLQYQQQQEAAASSRAAPFSASPSSSAASGVQMRQLLLTCADLISNSHFSAAHRLLSFLSAKSSTCGDSMDRLVHQFVRALSLRLNRRSATVINDNPFPLGGSSSSTSPGSSNIRNFYNNNNNDSISSGRGGYSWEEQMSVSPNTNANTNWNMNTTTNILQSCYLSLNQITPFIRFSHLTANQAILEAIQVEQQAIHIIDFDIIHGLQWPPLMQALTERSNNSFYPPPMLRITAMGDDLSILQRTGDRLLKFAQSLGLRFQFHPLLLPSNDILAAFHSSAITILPHEALAVNCVLYLHRLLRDDSRELRHFLNKIKALNPNVVTVAEREANHNHPVFWQRFVEALDHYSTLFDSLEATLPPNNKERLSVEQIWFGREIMDIVAGEGEGRKERHERFEFWEMMMRSACFTNVPLSPFALSQAKLLLRLHYPSEGYHLQILKNFFFLGWQNRALFSISSWH